MFYENYLKGIFSSLSAPYKRLYSAKFMTCYEWRDSVKDQKKIIAVIAQHSFMAGQDIFHTAVNSSPGTIASPQTLNSQPVSVDHIDCSHPFKSLNFILVKSALKMHLKPIWLPP